ncbi:MAG: DUF4445 domain-containing protein [Planctomycetes bacterium]|nr:DUF4445 domain-containing protein [Planctomycetota bacterium]
MSNIDQTIKIIFQPEGRAVHVLPGTTIFEAAGKAGIVLETPCGGKGACGKCRVTVVSGRPEPTDADREAFSDGELRSGWRLACQNRLTEAAVVEVPQDARFFGQKILVDGIKRDVAINPTFRKIFVTVPEPTLEDARCDLDRLKGCLADVTTNPIARLPLIRTLPRLLDEHNNEFTVVLENDEIITIEKGDTTGACHGVAIDIGTTSVVGILVDLVTGESKLTASRMNPQVSRGDDVVSRLSYISENEHGLQELHERIIGCVNEIVAELCEKASVPPEQIYELAAVGNTTMNHIFLAVDPRKVAQAPFAAVLREAANVNASDIGISINPFGNVYTSPNIAGFVGGDTVAVILATGMIHGDGVRLAIDIGTNGELVLATKDRVISCSTAAGPAFEGARIQHGMRAAGGAIDKVVFNKAVRVTTIADAPPRGICGTGLIDSVAEMVRTGVVDYTGRIIDVGEAELPDFLKRRVVESEAGNEFVLVDADKTDNGKNIVLTQRDVREVQLAKGAMRAGIQILLSVMGLAADDIDEVYLAGAFGNFIRRSMAKQLGLLPDIPSERIAFVGNAAATGARMVLAARELRAEAEKISKEVEYIELAGRPDFQQEFMSSMLFPT